MTFKHLFPLGRWTALSVICVSSAALAVTTSHWAQNNEADFKAGKFHNVVATNLGDLKLSRQVQTLLAQDPKVSAVYALAEAKDGTVYAGTGPQGVLLSIKDQKVTTVVELGDGINISSLLVDSNGALLLGTNAEKGKVLKIDHPGEKPHALFEADGVQYIWSILQTDDGNVYAATGPNAQLFEIKPDGSHTQIFKTDDNNFLSMISDGKDLLYIGSDPNGLVYRVNRKTHESFVLYDAAEAEVGALALDRAGNLYVGTSEASDEAAPAADTGEKDKQGRPEGNSGGVPIQSTPPANPAPPVAPNPNPGQPNPLPKMDILPATAKDGGDEPGGEPGADPGDPGGQPGGDKPAAPAAPDANAAKAADAKPASTPVNTAGTGQAPSAGNAIYKIDPNGFVTEIFREPTLILSIVEHNGILLVATGSDGLVYQIDPAADETVVIAKVDAKQITTLLPTRDGQIILGTANVGELASMGSGYAGDGTYTSDVLDATQISKFGKIQMHGTLPAGTTLSIATRSGNVKEPTDATWSKWSDELPAAEFVQSQSPAARFFQYRFTFATKAPAASPVVNDVDVAYLMPNLPPQIRSIKVTLGSKAAAPPAPAEGAEPASGSPPPIPAGRIQTITWDASDPNSDALLYSLYYRQGAGAPWILLKDKLKDTSYEWDTRSVADGRYQVKVVASDAAANPVGQGKTANRVSDTVLVDNTPPTIGDIKTAVNGNSVTVSLRAVDRTGTIAGIDYAVDSSQDWQAATASDSMFDSPDSAASLTVANLSPGPHEIAIRATDNRGNQAYQSVLVNIGK
jgi:hypothetical protein